MALGSITSLGVGSGLELQNILDQLRKVDETSVNMKKNEQTMLEEQVAAYDSINVKLIQMKSSALSLSLESNFLERSVQVSDEDIATATAATGTKQGSHNLEVHSLAEKSAWQSNGVEEQTSLMYAPPETGLESANIPAVDQPGRVSFTIGHGDDRKNISLDIQADASLKDIADAINTSAANQDENGDAHVKAGIESGHNGRYIRLSSTDDNSLNNNQILMTEGPAFIAPDLAFSYQTGATSDPVYVTVPPDTSYSEVASLVNEDANNSGMTASLIDDGSEDTPWHLTFTSDTPGENQRIFLNGINMTETEGGDGASLNAFFSVNGFEYQRQSNDSLDDVIKGITFDLKKTGETQINVSSASDTLTEKLVQFVDTYNEMVLEIAEKTRYSEDEEQNGVLSSAYTVKALGSDVLSHMTSRVPVEGKIQSLMDMGMELNKDGTIKLDESKITSAFNSDADDVARLFIGDKEAGITGLGDILNDRLNQMTGANGLISGEKSAAEGKIDRLRTSIDTAEERLEQKFELLAKDFVRLDALIGTMNSQSDYLTSVIDSFNNAQKNQ